MTAGWLSAERSVSSSPRTLSIVAVAAVTVLSMAGLLGEALAHSQPSTCEFLAPDDRAACESYRPDTTRSASLPVAVAHVAPEHSLEPPVVIDCAEFDDDGNFVRYIRCPYTAEWWRTLVERYFPASRVEQALSVMGCESGGNPDATNSRSGAAGLFQHLPRYWEGRSTSAGWGGADIYNPQANIAVAAWLAADGASKGLTYWHHWVCKP